MRYFTFCQNFCSRDDTIFCGVFDGHGPYGHLVAKRVRDLLPVKLGADMGTDEGRETPTSNMEGNTNEVGLPVNPERKETTTSVGAEQDGEYPEIFTTFRTSFLRAFHIMDRDLKLHKNIDCFFSGTTAVAVLKQVMEPNAISWIFNAKLCSEVKFQFKIFVKSSVLRVLILLIYLAV